MKENAIFWFRRDLRLDDNSGLATALSSGKNIIPIFIYDRNILEDLPADDARITLIHHLLNRVNSELREYGTSLATFHGAPQEVLLSVALECKATAVFTNRDYEPYAQKRDIVISTKLEKHNISFHTFKDQVIFEKDEITKDDGSPYVVFTPYSKKWKSEYSVLPPVDGPAPLYSNFGQHHYSFLKLSDIGFTESAISPKPFSLSEDSLMDYSTRRDIPSEDSTTGLSPFLRFGAVSIRKIIKQAILMNQLKLVDELIWREFFMQILWHFPHTVTQSFKPTYDFIKWRNDESEFARWCNGTTGYPIVDAGMRELNTTGIMHNRVRMITAGFLCKHLLIDWRWGEAYFASKLLDYEQASNVGNWQWAAGSGVDAAPYFRIFNPTEQVKKFDKDLKYIRKWVPEFEDFSYPAPIVDHREARERCLKVYREALVRD